MVLDLLPKAAASPEGEASSLMTPRGKQTDFESPDLGRPNLYVDFLGDNNTHLPQGSVPNLGGVSTPGGVDQSKVTNPGLGTNTWEGYTTAVPGTVFWVGVGVDRTTAWEILNDGNGLYSLEAGFYYDSHYIEPYTGGDYATTIRTANIGNTTYPTVTQWSDDYTVLHAQDNLDVQVEPITQEIVRAPSQGDIMANQPDGNPTTWRMTYVSLEKAGLNASRLAGQYAPPDPGKIPDDADPKNDTQYLLLIPFVLKNYDANKNLCLRLARNATHLSIGGGADGAGPYAAWDKTTVRNPGRELKLQTRFTGDLNIFTGGKAPEISRDATLVIENGGSADNTAKLSVTGDPSPAPVYADKNGEKITGLKAGVGLTVDITQKRSNYKVSVVVSRKVIQDDGTAKDEILSHTVVTDQKKYALVMPDSDVTVTVIFEITVVDVFQVLLEETVVPADSVAKGNVTTVTTHPDVADSAKTHSFGSGSHQKRAPAVPSTTVKVEVAVHADYLAEVTVLQEASQSDLTTFQNITGEGATATAAGLLTFPYGGSFEATMPESDIRIRISYKKAPTQKVALEVYHSATTPVSTVMDINIAQLAYDTYDDANNPSNAYSGQVYEDDLVTPSNHAAVKNPSGQTPYINASDASLSQSLGGDTGRTGKLWTDKTPVVGAGALTSLLYAATDVDSFAAALAPIDLAKALVVEDTVNPAASRYGLRRDSRGGLFAASQMAEFAAVAWELRTKIITDPALLATYVKTVTHVVGGVTTDSHYYIDITPAQVQAYMLDSQAVSELHQKNVAAYELAYRSYERALEVYETVRNETATASASAPVLVTAPEGVTVAAGGQRTYTTAAYNTTYLAAYTAYITAYQTYIEHQRDGDISVTAPGDPYPATNPQPVELPARQVVGLLTDAAAQAQVAAFVWKQAIVGTTNTITTRSGRMVNVVLQADSGYEVDKIQIVEDSGATTILTPHNPDYINAYAFPVPSGDSTVQVFYRLRTCRPLELSVTGPSGKIDNKTTLLAFGPQRTPPPVTAPLQHFFTNTINADFAANVDAIYLGSTVTMTVKKATGYNVAVSVVNKGSNTAITAPGVPQPDGSTVYQFEVPANVADPTDPVKVTVAYTPANVPTYTATIRGVTYAGTPTAMLNTALWQENNATVRSGLTAGTPLNGIINVAPGYYIHSVTAQGATGSYYYTITGNGYNNGLGTYRDMANPDSIYLTSAMPSEDLLVTVTYRRGIPPVAPDYALNLYVVDDDNVPLAPATPADNWAKLTVKPADTNPDTIGPLGRAKGTGVLTGGTNAQAGDLVEVDFSAAVVQKAGGSGLDPDKSYYLAQLYMAPSHLAVPITWVSETKAQFIMPASSAGVTAVFKKGLAPTYFINVSKTEGGGTPTIDNKPLWVTSPTIFTFLPIDGKYFLVNTTYPERVPGTSSGGVGVGKPGELVTMQVQAAPGWYVQSVSTYTDDGGIGNTIATVSGDNNGGGGEISCTFRMPARDMEVVVHYRQGPRPAVPQYTATIAVSDPGNTTAADNWAKGQAELMRLDGTLGITPTRTLGKGVSGGNVLLDVLYPEAGNEIRVQYQAAAGFHVAAVGVTPSGLRIYPTHVTPNEAVFTMPGENVTVLVTFGVGATPPQYTANLILRPPGGETIATVGKGTFTAPTGGTLTDYPLGAVYQLLTTPGTPVGLDLFAFDGYYIRAITVDPAAGTEPTLTGGNGGQQGGFVMPGANVNVNVWFEKGWPDEVRHSLTLRVQDPNYNATNSLNNAASFQSAAGAPFAPPDGDLVYGGGSRTIVNGAKDRDRVVVAIAPRVNHMATVRVYDAKGTAIPWQHVPGGIAFEMQPSAATVSVYFNDTTNGGGVPANDLTLITDGKTSADSVHLARADGVGGALTADGVLTAVPTGHTLTLTATPGADRIVKTVWARDGAGNVLPLTPNTSMISGGTIQLAMPDSTATVYVVYGEGTALTPTQRSATLLVSGDGPGLSGTAQLKAVHQTSGATLATSVLVDAPGGDTIFADPLNLLTATFTPRPGYTIDSVAAWDGLGNAVPYTWQSGTYVPNTATPDPDDVVWQPNPLRQITLPQAATGVTIHVTYGKLDAPAAQFTAQVVVNDEAYNNPVLASTNNAWLRAPAADPQAKRVAPQAGDLVYLDVVVHPGYQVEYVKIMPQSHGLSAGLTLGPLYSQTTSFVMPADNVVVYVKFVPDGLVRRNATLVVTGTPGVTANIASITSAASGTKGPIHSDQTPVNVLAHPATEWVTVDYTWNTDTSSVAAVTVVDTAGVPVAFTQVNPNQITLLMADKDIVITVTYRSDPTPVGYPVNLHVVDLEGGIAAVTQGYGQLVYTAGGAPGDGVSADTGRIAPAATPGGNTATISVPAGKTVDLTAFSNDNDPGGKIYIESAYVLYREGGQMIRCNLTPDVPGPGFSGTKNATFAVHPGQNDVYISLTRTAPATNDYAAVLMLDGLAEDKVSTATINTSDDAAGKAVVTVNQGHGTITATQGETISVSVYPDSGYAIASILFSPLGIPIVPVRIGNTFTFTMPAQNVAVRVVLKKSSEQDYTATLHYSQVGTAPTTPGANRGDLRWTPEGAATPTAITANLQAPTAAMVVKENAEVTLTTTLDAPYVVLAAYVMRGGTMVPLSAALEGVAEGDSLADNNKVDATTTFIMPGGNVDIYLVATASPPVDAWRTAVLVVTDQKGTETNSGKNAARIKDDGVPPQQADALSTGLLGHQFLTVQEGQDVSVVVAPAAAGYTFDRPATISHSTAAIIPLIEQGISPYHYTYTVGACNSAVVINFKSAVTAKNPLTVEIVDDDNPSNGTVDNMVTATPTAITPLVLHSVTAAGAYQVIGDVSENVPVALKVTPAPGYYATAVFANGTDVKQLPLTPGGDGTFAGTIVMPNTAAHVTVTFYQARTATLVMMDRAVQDPTSQANMTEDFFGGHVVSQKVNPINSLYNLPRNTLLATTLTDLRSTSRLTAVLLTVGGSTSFVSPTAVAGVDTYQHKMGRADATMTTVVDDAASTAYVAAVNTVHLPTGCTPPTIAATGTGNLTGAIWTTAGTAETVTVGVTVPPRHQAVITAKQTDGTVVPLTGATTLTASGTVTFPMPAANVQVTVTYEKTDFDLTLRIVNTSGMVATTAVTPTGGIVLSADGATTTAQKDTVVDIAATPVAGSYVSAVIYQSLQGGTIYLSGARGDGTAYTGTFPMPADDTTVTVIYHKTPGVDDPALYTATTETVGGDGMADNGIHAIQNLTTTGLSVNSPLWTSAYAADQIRVAFTTAPGYYAVVTARRAGTNASVEVVQQGSSGSCWAAIAMPPADAIITVTYSTTPPVVPAQDVKLTLVGHDTQGANGASGSGGTLTGLTLTGAAAADLPDPKAPISITRPSAMLGDKLVLAANRGSGYKIVRATVGVPDGVGGEVVSDLPLSGYGTSATVQFFMPTDTANITVYYARIYTATLEIMGAAGGDTVAMTDSRTNPVSSTGTVPVTSSGDRLLELAGGERVETTAIPDTAAGRRLVGVVHESSKYGASATDPNGDNPPLANQYDFTMPDDDVTVAAVFETTPADPKDNAFIAKVAIHPDSQGYGVGGNKATIANTTAPTMPAGTHWTAAKQTHTVTVTVGLEPGYQAVVTSAREDHNPSGDSFHHYVTRTSFFTTGKTTVFTMPADDTTLTIKYIKGYNLSLLVNDASKLAIYPAVNSAAMTATDNAVAPPVVVDTITGISRDAAGTITYDSTLNTPVEDGITTIFALPGGIPITSQVTAATQDVRTRVFRTTPFGGTTQVPNGVGGDYPYGMPTANTVESVLFQDKNDPHQLLAQVEMAGESDVWGNGDGTHIADGTNPPPATTTGGIWTTTKGANTIDVTLTVAKGYLAKVKVRRDDSVAANPADPTKWVYLDAKDYSFTVGGVPQTTAGVEEVAFGFVENVGDPVLGQSISAPQHFTFKMPENNTPDVETDVTVIIEYLYAGTIPAPYAPENAALDTLKAGWIYGENRGDYALIEIPTLEQDGTLYDTDSYDKSTTALESQTNIRFQFYLYDKGTQVYTQVEQTDDIVLEPYNPSTLVDADDPYNYQGLYTDGETPPRTYVGAKFILRLVSPAPGDAMSAQAAALKQILDNDGSLDNDGDTQLYVRAVNAIDEQSAYTQVLVRPYYALAGTLVSYAPSHHADIALYSPMTAAQLEQAFGVGTALDLNNPAHYEKTTPTFQNRLEEVDGSDKWKQSFAVKSSELLGDPTATPLGISSYLLEVSKGGNITYHRVNVTLDTGDATHYDPATRTFKIGTTITLIAGDVDGDQTTKWPDYTMITDYIQRAKPWSKLPVAPSDPAHSDYETDVGLWAISVYNPAAAAYRCDLNGDRMITIADLNVLTTVFNYNRTQADYNVGGTPPVGLLALEDEWNWLDELPDGLLDFNPQQDAQIDPLQPDQPPLQPEEVPAVPDAPPATDPATPPPSQEEETEEFHPIVG